MLRHSVPALIVFCAGLASASALAAASDQAPSTQLVNPSKAEPMMIEPSPRQEAAAYRRDIADCDSHSAEGRQICRDMVNEQYRSDATNASGGLGRCDDLEGAARADCLGGDTSGGQP